MPIPNHCIDCDKVATVTLNNVPYCVECGIKEQQQEPITDCCGALFTYPGWPESDFCSICGEHSGIYDDLDDDIEARTIGVEDGKS